MRLFRCFTFLRLFPFLKLTCVLVNGQKKKRKESQLYCSQSLLKSRTSDLGGESASSWNQNLPLAGGNKQIWDWVWNRKMFGNLSKFSEYGLYSWWTICHRARSRNKAQRRPCVFGGFSYLFKFLTRFIGNITNNIYLKIVGKKKKKGNENRRLS